MLPYQGIATFLKSPIEGKVPFAFMGLPYDCSTSFRPGARLGPNAIRQASLMLTDGDHPIFNVDPTQFVVDMGDAPISHVNPAGLLLDVEQFVTKFNAYHPVIAGGDHLTTLGVLRSLYYKHGQMALIHFDSHCDTWGNAWGEKHGHGTWLRNAIEEGLVNPELTMQLGIRSPVDALTQRWLPDLGGTVFSARKLASISHYSLWMEISKTISKQPTYISFDIDALDPAYAPGTGTPEIGGMSSIWALETLENLRGLNCVGMDVVEVAPPYDNSGITALAAATLLWTYIAMQI
jgi:agmatinase